MSQQESYTEAEQQVLLKYFSNCDKPVFALFNLPEVVKGALFARYSRSHKSLRRIFLDEFCTPGFATLGADRQAFAITAAGSKAAALYKRVFIEYGDDSVAQLGGAHIACERVSNVLTKILERGRLAAYLEQSTRYLRYDLKQGGQYQYVVPPEIEACNLTQEYRNSLDNLLEIYSSCFTACLGLLRRTESKPHTLKKARWENTLLAKACDSVRGILPAAVMSNVGIFATGQAFEALLIKMNAHPLDEARNCAAMILEELTKVVPDFVRRVTLPDRGIVWSQYLSDTRDTMEKETELVVQNSAMTVNANPEVQLIDWDKHGEVKVLAAALYESSNWAEKDLLRVVNGMSTNERKRLLLAYCGKRQNYRHKPGRAMENTFYKFDILSDYGSFRDLQRHRLLTIEWQRFTPLHGYSRAPELVLQAGKEDAWDYAMEQAKMLWQVVADRAGPDVAQYTVPLAYKIRYSLKLNAREAFHLLELRTGTQAHPDYKRICVQMHKLIHDVAGHATIATAMNFVANTTKDSNLPRQAAEVNAQENEELLRQK